MKWTTRQIFAQITAFWKSQSKKNKIRLASAAALLLVITVVLTLWINHSNYVTLYSGLSTAEMGEVVARLNELGIDFKTKKEGIILVPEEKESELQMTLASEGYPQTTLNYDIFKNNSGFTTTDYEKKKYLLFQLQNRLQDAIKTIEGVKGAIVTISLPEEDSFVLQEDKIAPTASVMLTLSPSMELSSKQIKGIESLVAKSVPGLQNKDVAIISNTGDILNEEEDTGLGSAHSRLDLEKSISSSIENKILKLLSPIFGTENVRIAVNTQIDINKRISEQTIYTPVGENSGLISSQDISKEGSGTSNDSTVGGVPGSGSNVGVATYAQSGGASGNGNYNESSSTNYLSNQTVEQIQREGYEITDLTVAVLIGNKQLTAGEMSQYQQMVAFAAGVVPEKVAIANATFASANSTAAEQLSRNLFSGLGSPYVLIAGAAVGLLLLWLIMRWLKRKRLKRGVGEVDVVMDKSNSPPSKRKTKFTKELLADEIVLSETREQSLRRQIKDFSSSNTEIVAQLIKTWIKEDDDNE